MNYFCWHVTCSCIIFWTEEWSTIRWCDGLAASTATWTVPLEQHALHRAWSALRAWHDHLLPWTGLWSLHCPDQICGAAGPPHQPPRFLRVPRKRRCCAAMYGVAALFSHAVTLDAAKSVSLKKVFSVKFKNCSKKVLEIKKLCLECYFHYKHYRRV
jgi:hypothetical protein